MHFSTTAVAMTTLIAHATAHGLVTAIQGANGVTMPALGVIDGTPRDCSTAGCGAEADVPVFAGSSSPLGTSQKGGAISAATSVAQFMGTGASGSAAARFVRVRAAAQAAAQQSTGTLAQGTATPPGTKEDAVAASAGQGAKSGLPTANSDGTVNLQFHQVNADGAGPYTASVDPTSGGTQEAAFQPATMVTNVPGTGGDDAADAATDFNVSVQIPAGVKCSGTVAGQKNVCVVRIQNPTFGGSAVFQQAGAAAAGGAAASASPAASAVASASSAASAVAPASSAASAVASASSAASAVASAAASPAASATPAAAAAADISAGDAADPGLQSETANPINGGAPAGAVAGGQDANAQVIDARGNVRRAVAFSA